MLIYRPAPHPFQHLPISLQKLWIELSAVSEGWFGENAIMQCPIFLIEIQSNPVSVAPHVSRIVPGPVVHHGPSQELGSRIMAVTIVVDKIRRGEFANGEGEAVDVHHAWDLVGLIAEFLLFTAEAPGLAYEKSGEIRSWIENSDPRNLAIGEAGNALRLAQADTAGDFRVEH